MADGCSGRDDVVATHPQRDVQSVSTGIAIRHDRVHVRVRDNGSKMRGREARSADDQLAGHAVQFDERQRGGKLISRVDENGSSGELRRPAAEARAVKKTVEG